jgi:hypothetical protein
MQGPVGEWPPKEWLKLLVCRKSTSNLARARQMTRGSPTRSTRIRLGSFDFFQDPSQLISYSQAEVYLGDNDSCYSLAHNNDLLILEGGPARKPTMATLIEWTMHPLLLSSLLFER